MMAALRRVLSASRNFQAALKELAMSEHPACRVDVTLGLQADVEFILQAGFGSISLAS